MSTNNMASKPLHSSGAFATFASADFEAVVTEDMAWQLRRQVEEHADWLKANCERQVHLCTQHVPSSHHPVGIRS